VKYYEKGSTVMGADQVAEGLARRGWEASSIEVARIGRLRRHVLVFIKTSRLDHLLLARARGNRLVLDVQDTVVFKRRIKSRWLYDALIFKNAAAFADFGRPRSPDRVIPHQWDPRYSPHRAPTDRLRIAYFGIERSLHLWGRIPGVECIAEDWFARAREFNCHLSVRLPGREARYKPNTKVSTAAACGANLVTTRDASSVELLGEDYPYLCGSGRAAVLAGIERARRTFGTALWEEGLARMRVVRAATALDAVLDRYEELLRDVGARLARGG
jgi:hypothetical protein